MNTAKRYFEYLQGKIQEVVDHELPNIEKAAQLGVEYFVIDAGWFGKGENWARARCDWEENLDFGFKGRMLEAAELVRASGMKFGLWLEPESAVRTAAAVEAYPEYYLENDPGSHL